MASHNTSYKAGEAKGQAQEKTNQMMDKTAQTAQAAKDKTFQTAEAAKDKTVQTAQAAKEKATQTGQAVKDKTSETADATKKKSQETGQVARDSTEAGKEKTGGILSQTGDQVKSMAQGAADAVKHTFGFDSTCEDQGDQARHDTTKETAQAAKDKTVQTAQAAKDKAGQAAQAAKDKVGQTAQAARDKTSDTADATKKKSQETGQVARDSSEAGKEKTGGILSQTGEQVKSMAQGASDAVKHSFGFDVTGHVLRECLEEEGKRDVKSEDSLRLCVWLRTTSPPKKARYVSGRPFERNRGRNIERSGNNFFSSPTDRSGRSWRETNNQSPEYPAVGARMRSNQETRGKGLMESLVPEKVGVQSDKEHQPSNEFKDCGSASVDHDDILMSGMQVAKVSGGTQDEEGVDLALCANKVSETGPILILQSSPNVKPGGIEVGGPSTLVDGTFITSKIGLSDSGVVKIRKSFNWKRVAREKSKCSDLGEKLKLGKRGISDEVLRDRVGGGKVKKVWKKKDVVIRRDGEESLGVIGKSGAMDEGADFEIFKIPSIEIGVEDGTVMGSDGIQLDYENAEMVTGKSVSSKAEIVEDQSSSAGRFSSVRRTQ
ncbi:hypothetical protein Q3G72_022068 [Acer saccharum]|nr:hypothetical protein Q3G72_022068 [Acer saccharum]